MPVLFMVRGLPGAGKSTLIKKQLLVRPGDVVCSADDYFMIGGVYCYDPRKIGEAQHECMIKAMRAMDANRNTHNAVIIDNTNLYYRDMQPYLAAAESFGYDIHIIEFLPTEDLRFYLRNVHSVPAKALARMYAHYEFPEWPEHYEVTRINPPQ